MADHENAPLVYLVEMTQDATVIVMNMLIACCIDVEIVNDFFQRHRCAVGKEKLLANRRFFVVKLYLYVPRGKQLYDTM